MNVLTLSPRPTQSSWGKQAPALPADTVAPQDNAKTHWGDSSQAVQAKPTSVYVAHEPALTFRSSNIKNASTEFPSLLEGAKTDEKAPSPVSAKKYGSCPLETDSLRQEEQRPVAVAQSQQDWRNRRKSDAAVTKIETEVVHRMSVGGVWDDDDEDIDYAKLTDTLGLTKDCMPCLAAPTNLLQILRKQHQYLSPLLLHRSLK